VDEVGSESCQMADFGVSCVESSSSATSVLVKPKEGSHR
jgi:hypothetical protein